MNNKDMIRHSLMAGLILSGVFVLWNLIVYVAGFDLFTPVAGLIQFVLVMGVYIAAYIVAGRKYRDKFMEGHISYGRALVYCLVMAVVSTLIVTIYTYLFNKFFDPAYALENAERVASMISENENIPEEGKEEIIARIFAGISPEKQMLQALKGNAVFSVIMALLSALFVRRKAQLNQSAF